MIISTSGVDRVIGVHLNKIYRTSSTSQPQPAGKVDMATISKFSALVERARARAMSAPEVRADRIEQVRSQMESGELPAAEDVASALINRAVEGEV